MEHNVGRVDRVDSANLFKSTGWRALRNWFRSLSPRARSNAIRWMRTQLDGVEKIKRAIEAEGGTFDPSTDLADVDFTIRTDDGVAVTPLSLGDDAEASNENKEHEHVESADSAPDPRDRNPAGQAPA